MNEFPLVTREDTTRAFPSAIPLTFVYPGLSLSQILTIVWAYRRLSVLIGILVLAMTIGVISIWPRTYNAIASLMVTYEVNDPLNGKELPVGQVGSYIATQVELMQSPDLLLSVVDRLQLTRNENYVRGFRGDRTRLREWVATNIGRNLAIYQGQRGSQLIYVTFSARRPADAALFANTVAEVYKEQDLARSTGPPSQRARLYAQQLGELKNKVDLAQKKVTDFHQLNRLVDEGNRANVDVVLLATLEGRLLEAQTARRVAEAQASGDQSVTGQVLASVEVQALKAQLASQELRLAELNQTYTAQHPDVARQQALIPATRLALANALQNYAANASGELSVAQRLEQNMLVAVGGQRRTVLANTQLHDEAARYLLDLQSAQSVYKRALEGYDQLMFAAGGHYSNVSLISRATPPVKASAPRVKVALFLGGIAALILGLGIPLAYELFNRRVRCRDDIERHHGVPVLIELDRLSVRTI
jgi:polysaccharide biosynthesis transport protein